LSGVAIALLFGLGLIGAALRGARWAFAWIYIPILILTPYDLKLDLGGFPAITARGVGAVGLLVGAVFARSRQRLMPAWRWFDVLPLLTVLSFAVSYAQASDLKGFVHRLPVLTADWLFPYFLARVCLRSREDFAAALPAFAVANGVLAALALAESRLHMRFAYEFWNRLGGVPVPQWYIGGGARLGFLRAMATFNHPITLGVFFSAAALVLLGWGLLVPSRRRAAAAAVAGTLLGAFASLSRGPLLGLAAGWLFAKALAKFRVKTVVAVGALGLAVLAPFLINATEEVVAAVETDLQQTGNVTNTTRYRVALFVVYLDELAHVGWWGNPDVVGRRFEKAWSIDNAYLYLFVVGGWLGGGLILAMTGFTLWIGVRSVAASAGRERALRATALGAFLSIAVSMLDVWFSPDYAAFYFVLSALVVNQASAPWGAAAVQRRQPPAPPPPVEPRESDDLSLARALRGRAGPGVSRAARVGPREGR
jgi:hypothetical protein